MLVGLIYSKHLNSHIVWLNFIKVWLHCLLLIYRYVVISVVCTNLLAIIDKQQLHTVNITTSHALTYHLMSFIRLTNPTHISSEGKILCILLPAL